MYVRLILGIIVVFSLHTTSTRRRLDLLRGWISHLCVFIIGELAGEEDVRYIVDRSPREYIHVGFVEDEATRGRIVDTTSRSSHTALLATRELECGRTIWIGQTHTGEGVRGVDGGVAPRLEERLCKSEYDARKPLLLNILGLGCTFNVRPVVFAVVASTCHQHIFRVRVR